MSGVYSSQAVILPCTETVPISDDIAAYAIASLLGVVDSNPPLITIANSPRASWSSVVQQKTKAQDQQGNPVPDAPNTAAPNLPASISFHDFVANGKATEDDDLDCLTITSRCNDSIQPPGVDQQFDTHNDSAALGKLVHAPPLVEGDAPVQFEEVVEDEDYFYDPMLNALMMSLEANVTQIYLDSLTSEESSGLIGVCIPIRLKKGRIKFSHLLLQSKMEPGSQPSP
ncbi:hypothetical protein Nepgr_005426 [Nepenthes gracilis]|uniref:Uncharacterized protein n=1 Tax=Nepenthes gracilis TaxID=150966 RepID=A0AAD3S3L2_NEPGR|nr:hypothetical protein Nepgr_005426 [Nepenthes gracilis]